MLIGNDTRKRIIWPLERVIENIMGKDGNLSVDFKNKRLAVLYKKRIQRIYQLGIVHKELESDLRDKVKSVRAAKIVKWKRNDKEGMRTKSK